VDAALQPDVYGSLTLDGAGLLVVRHRLAAGDPLVRRTVADVSARDGIAVIAVNGTTVTPDTVLPPDGDLILLRPRAVPAPASTGVPASATMPRRDDVC